jgi:hypothetical protein
MTGLLEEGDDLARDFGRHRRAAFVRFTNGIEQAGGRGFLQQIAARAVADGFKNLVLFGIHGQHQHLHLREPLAEDFHAIRTEHARQMNVEQQHFGDVRAQFMQRLFDRAKGTRTAETRRRVD